MPKIDWKNVGLPILLLVIAIGGYVAGAYLSPTTPPTAAQQDAAAARTLHAGDAKLAYASFSARASAGDAMAQYWLGDLYQHGLGVPKNPTLAVKWLTKSAQAGVVSAQRQLGDMYLNGDLVLQDFSKARKWLTQAALAGDPVSQLRLGEIYVEGLGGAADPVTGYAWYELAAIGGDNYAQIKRDNLLAKLTPAQQTAGEAKAKLLSGEVQAHSATQPGVQTQHSTNGTPAAQTKAVGAGS